MPDLCPTKDKYGFKGDTNNIGCNLSERGKMDVRSFNTTRYTNINGDREFETFYPSEPVGVLPLTSGLENARPSSYFSSDGGGNCDLYDRNLGWCAKCTDDIVIKSGDAKSRDCFGDTSIPTTVLHTKDTSKAGNPEYRTTDLDEFYTQCGWGMRSGWPSDGDTVLVGNTIYDRTKAGIQTWLAGTTQVLYPHDYSCENVKFPIPHGYINMPTENSGECDVHEEITDYKTTYNKQDQGDQVWISDSGWDDGLEKSSTYPGDKGCHFKYRKDWSNLSWGAPPLCMNNDCSEINPDITHLQLETENVENLPKKTRLDTYYDDNLIPKIRMACCTNVDDSGNWDNGSELNKEDCPITGLDNYSNNDIKTNGYGVYDPKSHVCARYDTSDGLFDTPDNWCSYKILQSDRFRDATSPALLPAPTNSINSFPKEEYLSYIKLLCDEQCIKWLELDFQNEGDKWTEVHAVHDLFKSAGSGEDIQNRNRINKYYNTKYRNKALGKKLSKFFVWVSKHLADPTRTPIGQNYPRYDLVQQEDIDVETNNNEKISWELKSKGLDETFEVSRTIERETTFIGTGDGQGEWLPGLCPAGQSMSGRYVGYRKVDDRTIENEANAVCQDTVDNMPELTQEILDGNRIAKINYDTMKADGFCESIGNSCHVDSAYDCESKFYTLKRRNRPSETFPCVQYNKDDNNNWVKVTSTGQLVSPPESTSPTGCGYSDPISLGSQQSVLVEDIENFKCSESPRLDICCSSLNAEESDIDNIDDLLKVENNINKNRKGLLSKNFRANSNLGKFLNLLCTPAAGAFLHFSPANNSNNTPNPDKMEFIKNMKIFSNRSDIFNWKDTNNPPPPQKKKYNKKYNELLKRRYSRLCNCFWDSQFKYDTTGTATEAATTAETTTSEKPDWCVTPEVNCVKYNLVEYKNEKCNPVAMKYYNIAFLSQCANVQTHIESTETNYLGLDADSCRAREQRDSSSLIAFAMKFQMDENPYTKRADKNDNSCWYDGCNGINNGSNSEDITDGNRNYGFKTLNSSAYIDSTCNAFNIKSLNCLATAGESAGRDLTIIDSSIENTAEANCSFSPVCNEGEIFSDEIDENNNNRVCEPISPPIRTQIQETFNTNTNQDIDDTTPTHTPSPTPSDDISLSTIILMVGAAIFLAALTVYLLNRLVLSSGSSKTTDAP